MIKKKRPLKSDPLAQSAKLETKISKQSKLAPKVKKVRRPRAQNLTELQIRRAEDSESFREKAARGLKCKAAATADDFAILDSMTGKKDWLPDPIASNLPHRDKIAELTSSMMLGKRAECPSLQVGFVTLIVAIGKRPLNRRRSISIAHDGNAEWAE